MPKGDDYQFPAEPEPENSDEGVALDPVGPRPPVRRRRRKRPPQYKLQDFLPSRKVGIIEAVALVVLGVLSYLVGQNVIWFIGVCLMLVALAHLTLRAFSTQYKSPLPPRVWDACYAFVAFLVWLAAAPAGLPSIRVIVENGSSHDVLLEVDGEKWVEVKAGTQELKESLPRKPFELVTRDARTREELQRKRIDNVSGRRYLLNVLGANTYFTGSVQYESEAVLKFRNNPLIQRYQHGPRPDGPNPTKDTWIHADHHFLFEAPPGQIRGTGGRSYLTRTPPF